MNAKRLLWFVVAMIFCFGLIAYVPAQATERSDLVPSKWGPQYNGGLQVRVQRSRAGNLPVNVVVYDRNSKVIASAELAGGTHTFSGLRAGEYLVAAEADDSDISLAQDVPVFAQQTTQVDLRLQRPAIPAAANAANSGSRACRGVAGDGRMIKVYPSYGATIIYLQCGHVVGKVMPSSCGCSAGNWRYTTDCQKSAPIYVNLPCPRH